MSKEKYRTQKRLLGKKIMSLPIRTTLDDVRDICNYLAKKPTGATLADAKSVLDKKRLDSRKISAYKSWGLISDSDGKMKLLERGRRISKDQNEEQSVFTEVIRSIAPYNAIVERAGHRKEDGLTAIEVATHWHEHFGEQASESDKILNDQAVCFFQIAEAAGLGKMVTGRKGNPTRFSFSAPNTEAYISGASRQEDTCSKPSGEEPEDEVVSIDPTAIPKKPEEEPQQPNSESKGGALGRGIFIAHGKNKRPLEQLKGILQQFHIPFKVAIDEPNLGRPIGSKIREIMESCNCAILIFTADEEFKDKDGNTIWRPSENVVYELGASGYLYDNRIVIMKESEVHFPSNFQDIGYISFQKDDLESKTMDILKELIGFGIVKIST
jgi:predicted nucleotide-binding protein